MPAESAEPVVVVVVVVVLGEREEEEGDLVCARFSKWERRVETGL